MKPTTRTLLPLAGAALAYSLAQTMVIPALPELQAEFHANPADATWLLTAFLLTSSVATPLLGRLGDMHGKERWLLISLAIFGVGSLIAALGGSLAVLITGRAVQGAGGAIFPLAIGIIRDEFPRERVAPAIGTVSAMFGIGGGTGLVLAGLFVDHGSISWIFWLSVVTTAMAALATWLWVPESPVRVRARIDWVGGALMSLLLIALLLPISEGNSWGWTSGRVLGLFAATAVLAVVWARWELHVDEPLVDLTLMRERPVWTTNVAGCAIGFAMFGSFVLIPQFVQTPSSAGYGFGASVTESGLFLLPSALLMLFAGPFSGRLGGRYGSRVPLALGALSSGLSYAWLAAFHGARIDIYLASVLLGLGVGMALAAMANLVVEAVPPDVTGVATAINAIMRTIGGAVGAQVAAAIVSGSIAAGARFPSESGFTGAFTMSALGSLVALLVCFAIPSRAAVRAKRRVTEATEAA
jgi:EmrB/QacA subfamily drug resistance transporter